MPRSLRILIPGIIITVRLFFTSASFAQSEYRFRHFTTDDGLANGFVLSIRTDSLGYVWCQYPNGLSRFDGYNFKFFQYDADDPNRKALDFNINQIMNDAMGNIWLVQQRPNIRSPFLLAKYDWRLDKFNKYEINVPDKMFQLRFENDNSSIWVGMESGLLNFNFESGELKRFMNPSGDSTEVKLHNSIRNIRVYDTHLLLSSARGLWIFDKKSHQFSRPPCDPKDSTFLYHSPIVWFQQLKNSKEKKSIWFRTGESIVKIDSTYTILKRVEKMKPGIAHLDTDREAIWFQYQGRDGLFHYDLERDSLINILAEPGSKFSLQSNQLGEITVDRDNSLWLATPHGVDHLMRRNIDYRNVSLPDLHSSILFYSGDEGYLIWNQDEKLLSASLDKGPDLKKVLKETPLPFKDAVISGFWKGQKYLWAATMGKVPNGSSGVVGFAINPKTKMVEDRPSIHFESEPNNPGTIASQECNDVWESDMGDLWITHGHAGISRVDLNVPYGSRGSVTHYTHVEGDTNSLVFNSAYSFFPEDKHSVWVITFMGVDLLHFDESKNVTFEHVFTRSGFPEVADVLFRTKDGNLFLGTTNGLYMASKNTGRYEFSPVSLLGKRSFNAIQEDQLGRLWLKTNKTLICFDRKEGTVVEFDERDGIDHLRSLELRRLESHDAMHRTKNGWLLVTDPDGATFFDPMSFKVDTKSVVPVFTNLLVNNQLPHIGTIPDKSGEFVIPNQVGALSELVLDYLHDNFSVEFSAMEMTAPEKNRYRHKLEGFDPDWIETDFRNRTASYTNLDPGTYTLRVRASNHHGVWSDKENVLAIVVLPPPWRTWWAYAGYLLLVAGGLVYARRNIVQRERLKVNLELEHVELEKAKEIDKLKTSFFANISHEFRTPITLILGPLKEMYNGTFKGERKSTLAVMLRNGQRLLRLINQLLDLSKIESGKLELHVDTIDLVQFLRHTTSAYESLAESKKIRYFFYPEVMELATNIDKEKFEIVIHNLVSNAFKFTESGGEVIVNLKANLGQAVIVVKDSGIGIPEDQLDKVFDRFYQVDNSQTREYEGTGLGLALTKELVELHHGTISVESLIGNGTTFTVRIPLNNERVNISHQLPADGNGYNHEYEILSEPEEKTIQNDNGVELPEQSPVLLIVEDNGDMRSYMQSVLKSHYTIEEATNGKEGVDKANELVPDLIISDIMMPEMDGYQLCERIKSNELTSHIPVILLTAKADRESKLTGLQIGADDYLSKPFDADELKLIVRNRVEEIRKLRERFSREVTLEPRKIAISSLDEKFLAKVMAIIEDHMGDELFSIDALSQEVGYSNMHFYRKIKALAGQTPSVFLRTIRLMRAAELLKKNSDNVTQIAYSVGFSSLSYFNKCFKDQFGVTPGQYAVEGVKR